MTYSLLPALKRCPISTHNLSIWSACASKKRNVVSVLSRTLRRIASRMMCLSRMAHCCDAIMAAIRVIGRARAFRGYHRRSEGMFGSALFTERRTFVWFSYTFQYESADAHRRFLSIDLLDLKDPLCVIFAKVITQFVSAFRNRTHPSPHPVTHIEDFIEELLCCPVSFA